MNRTLTALATAATLTLTGTAAMADAHAGMMNEGFTMLQTALMADFELLGIPTDTLDDLTLGQIAAIKSVVEGDEANPSKKGRIEAIIANN